MTNHDEISRSRVSSPRVIIGATCYYDAEAGLALATTIAKHIGAELYGMLVQDQAALSVVTAGKCTVISYSGTQFADTAKETLIQAWKSDVKRFESKLYSYARRAQLSAEFRVVTGGLIHTIQEIALSGDIAVIGYKRSARAIGETVAVVPAGIPVPELFRTIAQNLKTHLTVLRMGSQANDVLSKLERMSPDAVLLLHHQSIIPHISRIIEASRCPVVISPQLQD